MTTSRRQTAPVVMGPGSALRLSRTTLGREPPSPLALITQPPHLGGASRLRRMIDDLWYKNGVFYCLSVGTYMDANGDGIGDFKGLLRRLDYLHGLGITTIWLMPFQASPGRDDGYDIADYY